MAEKQPAAGVAVVSAKRIANMTTIAVHFEAVRAALAALDAQAVERAAEVLRAAKSRGALVLICGNGGSAATASHFACDLQKAAGVRAVALTDNVPLITAWANDVGYDHSMVNQFRVLDDGDNPSAVVLISCSGKSPNIVEVGRGAYRELVCLFGRGGEDQAREFGALKSLVIVPSTDYGVIEDVHLAICHALTKAVRDG